MSLLDTASLIVTPNGYKEGKLYSVIPSDGSGDMSVTRATTATRVNSAGLVELVPYNLLRYSEQFDNAAWAKETTVTVTPNVEIAPDGTLTADLINMPINRSMFQTFSIPAGEAATASVYIKGTAGETINFAVKSQNFTRVLTGEWQRIEATSSSSGTIFSVNRYSGGTASSFYLWGYQLVEGSTALPYQKTETRLNIPRLDYSNGTCPSILVEPQRTNLLTYSSSFDNAAWAKANTTVTSNATTAPDGTLSADKLIDDTTNGLHRIFPTVPAAVANTTYVLGCFVKKAELDYVILSAGGSALTGSGGSGADLIASVNLNNGAVVTNNYNISSVDYGNGWYRISIRLTTDVDGGSFFPYIATSQNGTTATYVGSSQGIYLWGAQLEVGSYPTSYIPTTSASVTRNADVISKTGISSLIGQTEGTLFVEIYNYNNFTSTSSVPFSISNGVFGDAVYFEVYQNLWYASVFNGFNAQFQQTVGTLSTGYHKLAIAYKANDFVFYVDGSLVASDTSGTVPSCSRVDIGTVGTSTTPEEMQVKAAALWKTRLTNTQLAQLTTI